jgi:hypothetical protein
MVDDAQTRLFGTDASAADAIVINDRCVLRIQDDQRIVVAAGVPLAHFIADDRMAEAYAMITLVEQGLGRSERCRAGLRVLSTHAPAVSAAL